MSDTTRFLLFHFFFCRFIFVCQIFPSFKQYQIPCFLSRNPLSHKPLYPSILYLFQKSSALLIHRPQFQYNRKQILFTHSIADHAECLVEKFVHFCIHFPHNDRRVNNGCHLAVPKRIAVSTLRTSASCFQILLTSYSEVLPHGAAQTAQSGATVFFLFSYFFNHRF